MIIKYTKEQEAELYDTYKEARENEERVLAIEVFAKKHNKTKRSIIAKLSAMGIYISILKISKVTGIKPETKSQIVAKIEGAMQYPMQLDGLEKAPKMVLMKILDKTKSKNNEIVSLKKQLKKLGV